MSAINVSDEQIGSAIMKILNMDKKKEAKVKARRIIQMHIDKGESPFM